MILVNVIDQPASSCTGSHVFIGPTAVDYSMLPTPARVPANESAQLKAWRAKDRRALHGHRMPYVNKLHPDRSF
jgi:hypothetical protein